MASELDLKALQEAVTGTAAAFRAVTPMQPVGGEGDKVFPPTYKGGEYATETRILGGESVPCVLLDSVQSQANRMELALLDAWERKRIPLPVITVDFSGYGLLKPLRVTSLEAPHRIADALLRDSLLNGVKFRDSAVGSRLDVVDNKNATSLFETCPTALVFGMWDSTGPRGGLGAKFARALVSEIVGLHAESGRKTSSRLDPAQIMLNAGPLYRANNGGWTLDEGQAVTKKGKPEKLGKDGKPSEANHGNVTPSIEDGGFTLSEARQTTVLSLPALRRLRFPVNEEYSVERDDAARTVLAALALCAASLGQEQGLDLRSRCQLHPTAPVAWEILDAPGDDPQRLLLPADTAMAIYRDAVEAAKSAGLPWMEEELVLKPSPELVTLVKKSQELAAATGVEGEE